MLARHAAQLEALELAGLRARQRRHILDGARILVRRDRLLHLRVELVAHSMEAPDVASFWASTERTMAPVVLLRQKMGAAWAPVGAKILASLSARFGTGPNGRYATPVR
mgnify:CR=1 FL=1